VVLIAIVVYFRYELAERAHVDVSGGWGVGASIIGRWRPQMSPT
jgi:hypothetical protein